MFLEAERPYRRQSPPDRLGNYSGLAGGGRRSGLPREHAKSRGDDIWGKAAALIWEWGYAQII